MTNFDFIKEHLTELDLAFFEFPHALKPEESETLFKNKIYSAWSKWAESCSTNNGNMAKGIYYNGEKFIKKDPSVWAWEYWYYPDGTWKKSGRNHIISFQVWLSKQYNPEEWEED